MNFTQKTTINEETPSELKITMITSKSGEAIITMAGSGAISIDWNDGSKIETHTLKPNKFKFTHNYFSSLPRVITITGENITYLYCGNNQLTSLEVSENDALLELYCNNNCLTNLNVSGCAALKDLNCHNNQLTSLNVEANTALTLLVCSGNQLTSLDVSKNIALIRLYCYNNQLTSLDASANTKLVSLDVCNNQITGLDASANTELIWFYCRNNKLTGSALDALFGTLHVNTIPNFMNTKTIFIYCNDGTSSCSRNIAEAKGWTVNTTTQ